jgi:hypothetical protein
MSFIDKDLDRRFPSLKWKGYDKSFTFVQRMTICMHCLDKQKVREAIKKARISSMTHKCPKCNELVWTTTREDVVSYIVLLQELGLDDEKK